ncbi:MAG TPA: hypothetical protein VF125_12575 [Solirubrobacterales bacterium]
MPEETTKFTLRFHNSRTHELLGVVAEQWGVSKNRLAEEMLERELNAAALLVAKDLDDTIRRLHAYRVEEHLEEDIQAFAEGEAYGDDPLRARMVPVSTEPVNRSDPYGVLEAFETS